jgi:hypothetical protein
MPAGAWIMLVFGAAVLYGGLAVCLRIAWKAEKAKRESASQPSSET